jgi:hypothetical protein
MLTRRAYCGRVSKHWNPRGELDRILERPRAAWPAGATVGVALIAVCCLGAAVVLYHVAAPRDVFGP